MKRLKLTMLVILTTIISSFAQEHPTSENIIETVYISDNVSRNDFAYFHRDIASDYQTSFREILKGVDRKNQLVLIDDDKKFKVTEAAYLKVLKKSVNKSDDFPEFIQILKTTLPELKETLTTNNSLRDLYHATKQNSFNSKLAALPSVL